MKKYIYIMEGNSGCDYSIGCGLTSGILDAENIENAKIKLLKHIDEDYSDPEDKWSGVNTIREEYGIEEIDIYEITDSLTFEIIGMSNDYKRFKKEKEQEAEEAEILRRAEEIKLKHNQ